MRVMIIANTQLNEKFRNECRLSNNPYDNQILALTAIRTCYSPLKPTEIGAKEGEKYFCNTATDGEAGTEADRLFRHITRSGHTSTLEHLTYTFAIEGVSRALLAQLTRHRHLSFSVQSQRYVRFGSEDKSGGFDYVTPASVDKAPYCADTIYAEIMTDIQRAYDALRECGVPTEDARMVLPQAATCNLVMTGNLRALLDFYGKRKKGGGAQWEIVNLAEAIRAEITKVDSWLAPYFGEEVEN